MKWEEAAKNGRFRDRFDDNDLGARERKSPSKVGAPADGWGGRGRKHGGSGWMMVIRNWVEGQTTRQAGYTHVRVREHILPLWLTVPAPFSPKPPPPQECRRIW